MDVRYILTEEKDCYLLTLTLDKEWLFAKERVFPVVVDPSVDYYFSGTGDVTDTMIREGTPTTAYNSMKYAVVGYSTTSTNKTNRGLYKIKSMPILSGSIISYASLTVRQLSAANGRYAWSNNNVASMQISARMITKSWVAGAVWNDNITFNSAALDTKTLSASTEGQAFVFNITAAEAWRTGTANNGILFNRFSDTTSTPNCYTSFYTSEHATVANKPVFYILYVPLPGSGGIYVEPSSKTMAVGETYTLSGHNNIPTVPTPTITWSSNNASVATVNTTTGKVTAVGMGTATITATVVGNTSVKATCAVTVTPLLIYQTRNTEIMYFVDDDDTTESIRPDLFYNDMSKSTIYTQVSCITQNSFYGPVLGVPGIYPYTPSERKDIFLNMATLLFANDTFDPIITDMIDHFMGDSSSKFTGTVTQGGATYSVYKNPTLTNQVQAHSESIRYVGNIKTALDNALGQENGNLTALKYDPAKRFNYKIRKDQPFVAALASLLEYAPPVFNSDSDKLAGFTICLDSLQGNKVEILSYHVNGNSYSGTMRVTYYDHFGLDVNDMTGNYGYQSLGIQSLLGFHQWFILQHWNDLNADVQPKPFITTIEFEVPFSGSF